MVCFPKSCLLVFWKSMSPLELISSGNKIDHRHAEIHIVLYILMSAL